MTHAPFLSRLRAVLAVALVAAIVPAAFAQEAVIRKNLTDRLPTLPKIDEITKTAVPGLWEVRLGTDIVYTDDRGDFLIEGTLVDTKTRLNLTEARVNKLTEINFASLPLKDAIAYKQGTGARKLVVFADPNCGYCKRFENEVQQVKDVTVYTFLIPILGGDSPEKSRNIWCAKDAGTVWRDWMIKGQPPAAASGACDATAIERNLALAKRYKVNGTPNIVFENGKRVPGAMPPEQVEKALLAAR